MGEIFLLIILLYIIGFLVQGYHALCYWIASQIFKHSYHDIHLKIKRPSKKDSELSTEPRKPTALIYNDNRSIYLDNRTLHFTFSEPSPPLLDKPRQTKNDETEIPFKTIQQRRK